MSLSPEALTNYAIEILHRSQRLRANVALEQWEDSEAYQRYLSNMTNSCLQLELLIQRTYLSETKLGQIKDAKFRFKTLIQNLHRIVFVKENLYERIIFKKLLNLVIDTFKAEGRYEAGWLLEKIGERQIAISEALEAVENVQELREAVKRAEDSKRIISHEENLLAEEKLHMLTWKLQASVGVLGEEQRKEIEEKRKKVADEEEDLLDFEVVMEKDCESEGSDDDYGFELV